ncbi:hypothetical protein Aperf_G00000079560 [Anoplocephala perfoliata]
MDSKIRYNLHLLLPLIMAIVVHGDGEFPEWDSNHWVVKSTDLIVLPCEHTKYYPFKDIKNNNKSIQWILPEATSYLHLKPGYSTEGWTVNAENYSLIINKTKMNVKDAANGMYVCAALAKSDLVNQGEDGNIYAWYYLRWGVGLYSNVPAMKEGTIGQKYYWCFTYAWVSCLVAITIIVLFTVTVHFHYKGSPTDDLNEESEVGTDGLSIKENRKSSILSVSSYISAGKRKKGLEVNADGVYH